MDAKCVFDTVGWVTRKEEQKISQPVIHKGSSLGNLGGPSSA